MTEPSIDHGRGRVALVAGHCAGLVDVIGLPLWVGVLVDVYRFNPQQAGGMATVFLAGVFLSSILIAPNFHRISGRALAVLGFGTAAACFWIAASTRDTALLLTAHGIAGLANGLALSVTHGTMSTSQLAHRLIGIAGVALGVFGMIFMAVVPKIMGTFGGPALFVVFGAVMAMAALFAWAAFPGRAVASGEVPGMVHAHGSLPRAVWSGLICWALVTFAFSMTNSFMERVGIDHGFSHDQVAISLLIMATVSMFAGALAVYLEGRVSIRLALFLLPFVFAASVWLVMTTTELSMYRLGMAMVPSSMIVMMTFLFGALSKLDRSGRSLASFPAAIMLGTALGPVVGGTLVKAFDYGALSMAAAVATAAALLGFLRLTGELALTTAGDPQRVQPAQS